MSLFLKHFFIFLVAFASFVICSFASLPLYQFCTYYLWYQASSGSQIWHNCILNLLSILNILSYSLKGIHMHLFTTWIHLMLSYDINSGDVFHAMCHLVKELKKKKETSTTSWDIQLICPEREETSYGRPQESRSKKRLHRKREKCFSDGLFGHYPPGHSPQTHFRDGVFVIRTHYANQADCTLKASPVHLNQTQNQSDLLKNKYCLWRCFCASFRKLTGG